LDDFEVGGGEAVEVGNSFIDFGFPLFKLIRILANEVLEFFEGRIRFLMAFLGVVAIACFKLLDKSKGSDYA
jgi:hypothetical protein